MQAQPTKSSQPPSIRRLIELMQSINFGSIEDIHISGGLPLFSPAPRVVREVKFGAKENGPRSERTLEDFCLRAPVVELIEFLAGVHSGVIRCIRIKHGHPFQLTVEEVLR